MELTPRRNARSALPPADLAAAGGKRHQARHRRQHRLPDRHPGLYRKRPAHHDGIGSAAWAFCRTSFGRFSRSWIRGSPPNPDEISGLALQERQSPHPPALRRGQRHHHRQRNGGMDMRTHHLAASGADAALCLLLCGCATALPQARTAGLQATRPLLENLIEGAAGRRCGQRLGAGRADSFPGRGCFSGTFRCGRQRRPDRAGHCSRPIFSFRIWQRRLHCWEPTATRSPVYSIYDTTMMGQHHRRQFSQIFWVAKNVLLVVDRAEYLSQPPGGIAFLSRSAHRALGSCAWWTPIRPRRPWNRKSHRRWPSIQPLTASSVPRRTEPAPPLRAVERYGRFVPIPSRRLQSGDRTGHLRREPSAPLSSPTAMPRLHGH